MNIFKKILSIFKSDIDFEDMEITCWEDEALYKLRLAAKKYRGEFTIEQIRKNIDIEQPENLRRWGAVTNKAIKLGYITRTGRFAPAESSNRSPKPLYVFGG